MSWRDAIAKAVLGGRTGGVHPGGIHTYHSSPHDFDKFDWSKLRSGEGANVYGAGFYSAESPKVSGQGGQYWNSFSDRFKGPEWHAAEMLRLNGFNLDDAIKDMRHQLDFRQRRYDKLSPELKDNPRLYGAPTQKSLAEDRQVLGLLESGNPIGPRTYELNLRVKPEELLDWDKPLAQQRPEIWDTAKRWLFGSPETMTGQEAYRGIAAVEDKTRASEALRDAGIPGIRYLDQGSRNVPASIAEMKRQIAEIEMAGKLGGMTTHQEFNLLPDLRSRLAKAEANPPTYNYVMFDPSRIDIMAKYALPGLATGGFGALAASDTYDPKSLR